MAEEKEKLDEFRALHSSDRNEWSSLVESSNAHIAEKEAEVEAARQKAKEETGRRLAGEETIRVLQEKVRAAMEKMGGLQEDLQKAESEHREERAQREQERAEERRVERQAKAELQRVCDVSRRQLTASQEAVVLSEGRLAHAHAHAQAVEKDMKRAQREREEEAERVQGLQGEQIRGLQDEIRGLRGENRVLQEQASVREAAERELAEKARHTTHVCRDG